MPRLYQILTASISLAALSFPTLSFPAYADYTLTILHTNDVHSRIE